MDALGIQLFLISLMIATAILVGAETTYKHLSQSEALLPMQHPVLIERGGRSIVWPIGTAF
jgi:hypothetical protein